MIRIVKAQKGTFFGVSGSIQLLEKQLYSSENVFIVVQGQHDDKPGVLAATDERVIFVGKMFFSTIVKEVPYSKLSSISVDAGILTATIKLEFSGGKLEVSAIAKDVARELVEKVKIHLANREAGNSQQVAPAPTQEDMFDKLKKLGELKEAGILTEEEFQEQKKKLLSM